MRLMVGESVEAEFRESKNLNRKYGTLIEASSRILYII